MENQPVGKLSSPSKFIWRIQNFSKLDKKPLHSNAFSAGGCSWRLMIYAKGYGDRSGSHLSVFIYANGYAYAEYSFNIVNQLDRTKTVRLDSEQLFNGRQALGVHVSSIPLSELNDPVKGYLVDDTCIIKAEISACRIEAPPASTAKPTVKPPPENTAKSADQAKLRKDAKSAQPGRSNFCQALFRWTKECCKNVIKKDGNGYQKLKEAA